MRSTACRRAWRCCLLWLLALAPAQAQQQQQQPVVVERVSDGQQLADAVAAYGRRNADTTLLVPANTTLRLANATFTSVPDAEAADGKAFSSGTLTIQGAGSQTSVIDAGMRAGEHVRLCAWAQPGAAACCGLQASHSLQQQGKRGANSAQDLSDINRRCHQLPERASSSDRFPPPACRPAASPGHQHAPPRAAQRQRHQHVRHRQRAGAWPRRHGADAPGALLPHRRLPLHPVRWMRSLASPLRLPAGVRRAFPNRATRLAARAGRERSVPNIGSAFDWTPRRGRSSTWRMRFLAARPKHRPVTRRTDTSPLCATLALSANAAQV